MAGIFVCIGYFKENDERIREVVAGLERLGKVELYRKGNEEAIDDVHCGRLNTAIHNQSMDEEEFISWLKAEIKSLLEGTGLIFKVGDQLPLPEGATKQKSN